MCRPLVSVIMGIYNCKETLDKSLDSLLGQTYDNIEIILCDDGSSDGTYQLAKQYQQMHDNIILLKNNENMKLAYSLNQCLMAAQGKYIARMDADDICLPNRIEKQVDFLERNCQYDVVGCETILFDEEKEYGIRKVKEYPGKKDLLKNPPFIHPTVVVRKQVYEFLKGYKVSEATSRAEDLEFWFRFFDHGYQGYNLQEPLLKYHESKKDYKKRTLKAAIGISKIYLNGYQMLGFSKIKNIYALKPIVSALIPNWIMSIYHRK